MPTGPGPEEPSRYYALEGVHNLRDIGGYATTGGRTTRWRTLWRAASLHALPPPSQQALLDHGLRTVIDLRRPTEIQEAPSVFDGSGALNYLNISVIEDQQLPRQTPTLLELYIIVLDRYREPLKQVIEALATPGSLPALVNCTAGKDRTGLIVALLLGVAGVPAATIARDYALSKQYLAELFDQLRRKVVAQGQDLSAFEHLLEAEEGVMLQTLDHLERRYGGAARYLLDSGLSPGKLDYLREQLLTQEA